MKNITATVSLLLVALSAISQKETRTIESFTSLDVGESITVYLTKGNSDQATIEASGGNTDRVLLDNVGNTLKVHMKSGSWRSFNATVYLEFQELESVEVSSSADVVGKSTVTGDDLEIEVSSSGSLELDIDVKSLDVDVSSSGKLELSGRAEYQNVDVSSSGRYFGSELQSDRVKIEASSSGRAEVYANSEIDAEANSSGRIVYSGEPRKVYVSSNSGGSVKEN